MTCRRVEWQLVARFTIATCLGVTALSRAQFTPFTNRTRALLAGNWQSCRESDGQYGERGYDGRWAGVPPIELHLGPNHEFALYRGIQDEHRPHSSPDNLLQPYHIPLRANTARHSWDVAACTSKSCSPAARAKSARAGM